MSDKTKVKVKIDAARLGNLIYDINNMRGDRDYYRAQLDKVRAEHDKCPNIGDLRADLDYYKDRCQKLEENGTSSLDKQAPYKIAAIKALRTAYPSLGLREAKDTIEALVGVQNMLGGFKGTFAESIINTAFSGN